MTTEERLALLAARAAAEIEDGMVVGLGSGSTAEAVVCALGERVATGLRFTGIPTSANTRALAASFGIPLADLDEVEHIDLGIDGADEIDPELNLIKGRGGALLWEKLVARACQRYLVVAASEKLVPRLGNRMPLPVEIVPFGWKHTAKRVEILAGAVKLRMDPSGIGPFETDDRNLIIDCTTGSITHPASLDLALKATTGVVDHGLFIGIADQAMIVDEYGAIAIHEPATSVPG